MRPDFLNRRRDRWASGESDCNARTGVPPFRPYGNNECDDGHTIHFIQDHFTMHKIAANRCTADDDGHDKFGCTGEVGPGRGAAGKSLDVDTVTSNHLIPVDRKWAVRFNPDGTVTIVLGMKDYGRGWYSAYFAGLVSARLGIPYQRVRVYYSGTLPAVLQTPGPSASLSRSQINPAAGAVADVIEALCVQAIERGRLAFAATTGVDASNIAFDQPTGRFFVPLTDESRGILEIANASRPSASLQIVGRQSKQP
jgi:Molybdopterin-binding domain of aldehyde dehydrogenase